MNSIEEKIYKAVAESKGISASEIASLAAEDEGTVSRVLSDSAVLNAALEKESDGKWHVKDYSSFFENEVLTDPELLLIIKK